MCRVKFHLQILQGVGRVVFSLPAISDILCKRVPLPAVTGYGIFSMAAATMSFLFASHFIWFDFFIFFFSPSRLAVSSTFIPRTSSTGT